MPFCTNCGHRNPDDANFCSQCGTRLESGPAEPSVESTATISIGGVSEATSKSDTSDRQLNPVDAAAVDALPTGHALLVVQRGPGSGSRFLLDQDVIQAGRNPDSNIFLDDVTVSRQHAEFHRSGDSFTVTDSAASTAPTSTATGSTPCTSPTVTRCRSASTASSSSPGTRRDPEPRPHLASPSRG